MITLLLCLALGDTITNGERPAKSHKLDLVEVYTVGGAESDLALGGAVYVTADKEGRMFAADPNEFRILIFDANGEQTGEFGTQGQGPGEFQGPLALGVDGQGRLAVLDTISKRLSRFQADGTYIDSLGFSPGIQAVLTPVFLQNGKAAMSVVQTNGQFQASNMANFYDADMNQLTSFVDIPQPKRDWSQMGDPAFWVDFTKDQFDSIAKGFPFLAALPNDHFVVMRSDKYEGIIYNGEGKQVSAWSKKYKPRLYKDDTRRADCEEIFENLMANPFLAQNMNQGIFDRAFAKMEVPPHLPPMAALFSVGKGFAVISNYDSLEGKGSLDVFDGKGNFKATLAYNGPLKSAFGIGDNLYITGLDEEDELLIRRFKISGLEGVAGL